MKFKCSVKILRNFFRCIFETSKKELNKYIAEVVWFYLRMNYKNYFATDRVDWHSVFHIFAFFYKNGRTITVTRVLDFILKYIYSI